MTQIVVTLDNDVNPGFIQKILENIRGVAKTSLQIKSAEESMNPTTSGSYVKNKYIEDLPEEKKKWFEKLEALRKNSDLSLIDMNDEKTRYILSK